MLLQGGSALPHILNNSHNTQDLAKHMYKEVAEVIDLPLVSTLVQYVSGFPLFREHESSDVKKKILVLFFIIRKQFIKLVT